MSGQQEYQDQAQYGQDGAAQAGSEQVGAQPAASAGKKKRAYAGQAFDFGTGANTSAAAAQPPAAGAPYGGAQPAGYGYPSQPAQPGYTQPAYGDQGAAAPAAQPAYGQPTYGAPAGYQAPDPGYPAPGVAQAAPGGVAGVTQQFGQMGFGGQQPAQPAPGQGVQPQQRLNPLQPVDISLQGQPFHVSDLDLPPPPLILPPNVCMNRNLASHDLTGNSRASHLHRIRMPHLDTYDPRSMQFQRRALFSKSQSYHLL
jgi:protein transport protein SEC24